MRKIKTSFKLHTECCWITSKENERNYCWIHIGPTFSEDGIKIYLIVIGRIYFAFGFTEQTPINKNHDR
jgi:hypothetical protein